MLFFTKCYWVLAGTREMRTAHMLVWKTERKHLAGSRMANGRWKDDIKMDLKEIGCDNVDWIYLVHDTD
jgi:hypothetical protein